MTMLVARAAVAACARASKRRRGVVSLLPPPFLPSATPSQQLLLRAALSTDSPVADSQSMQQHQYQHQNHHHLLRVVDLTTMRAAAASLRAFGGGGGDEAAAAAAEAAAAAAANNQSAPDMEAVQELANDPSDPPLLIRYAAASALQEALAEQLRVPPPPSSSSPPPPPTTLHTLLLLQHAPVFTVGKRGRGHGFPTDAHMRRALAAGAQLDAGSPRGGQATFHGPGQAVAYPVVLLGNGGGGRGRGGLPLGARRYVEALEDAAVRAVGAWGVRAEGRQPAGRTGVWAGGRKVAAVGVRVSRGVATHGLALNVASGPLLAWFRLIDPCGLGEEVGAVVEDEEEGEEGDDGVTTSLWRELMRTTGGGPTVRGVAGGVAHALAGALGVRAVWPGQEGGPHLLPLPPEAARAVLEGVACTAAALAARAPPPPLLPT